MCNCLLRSGLRKTLELSPSGCVEDKGVRSDIGEKSEIRTLSSSLKSEHCKRIAGVSADVFQETQDWSGLAIKFSLT